MSELKEYKFNDLYTMGSGISSKPEQAGHGFPFVSFSTVFNNYFLPDTLPDLMNASEQERNMHSVKKGDILLTRTSETIDELGMSCVAVKDYPNATFSGFVKRLRPIQSDVTYDKYMGFYLRSKFFRKIMTNNAVLTLRASLNEDIFSYIKLYLPKYQTQKNIGDFLFLLNSKIELNQRINTELEAMVKTLYDYWFVQFDFPNEKGKPYKSSGGKMVWNQELKREIPLGWSVGSLLDIADYENGLPCQKFRPAGKDFLRVIKIKEMRDGFTKESESVRPDIPESAIIENGDVLFSWSASLEVIIWSGGKGALNQHIFKVTSKNYPKSFYYYQLLNYLQHFKMMAENRKTTMGHITQDHLKQSRIVLPPKKLTEDLDEIIAPVFEKKVSNEIENHKLAELRDWLLPMLMNGQVSISENASEGLKDKENLSSHNTPSIKKETSVSDSVYFRSIVPRREDRYVTCVPSLDFEIAAGAFGEGQRPNFNEWVEINTSRSLKKGMFVAKVVGHSMEPLIPDGAHCLFQFKAPQFRNDMIAVFQLHDSEDVESGGHYTVKRLRVYRQNTDEGVVRKAKLIPENPAFKPIPVDEDNVKFIAEFLEVLQPLIKRQA